jgi:diguanylate cyclase (GGDEF)-like protein
MGAVGARRAFEDRLEEELARARDDGTQVAVIVCALMGVMRVVALHGEAGGAASLREARRRLEAVTAGDATMIARVGEVEIAILLVGLSDRADVEQVEARIHEAFVEPVVINGDPIVMAVAVGTKIGPGRRGRDDLLWRAVDASQHARASIVQQWLGDVRGRATSLDEVAQTFADSGVELFALEACEFVVGERAWSAPSPLPATPSAGELPLRTEGRVIGLFRWWGDLFDDADVTGLGLLLEPIAASLDRASAVDASVNRSRTDPLTGLLNREGLAVELEGITGAFALGIVDLDHFKRVNDLYGHEVGDRVLHDLAVMLQESRTGDLVARWGGEEIVLVMPGTTVAGAARRLERLLEGTRELGRAAAIGPITFSAGVTGSSTTEPFADAVRRADEAMYRAKRAGRARVEVG